MAKERVLEVTDLELHYFTRKGVVKAVDKICFDLRQGETLGVDDGNGAPQHADAAWAHCRRPNPS
jgi:peptide/nickel transport system ATP-binding protein